MIDMLSGLKKMICYKGVVVGYRGVVFKFFKEGFNENFYDWG